MAGNNLILAGDIGGTKTHLGFFSRRGEEIKTLIKKNFSGKQHPRPEPGLKKFLTEPQQATLGKAWFGIAGPGDVAAIDDGAA